MYRVNVPILTLLLKTSCMCCFSSACIYESLKALCSVMILDQNVCALCSSLLPSWDNKALGKQLNYPIRHILLPITLSETDSFFGKSFMSKNCSRFFLNIHCLQHYQAHSYSQYRNVKTGHLMVLFFPCTVPCHCDDWFYVDQTKYMSFNTPCFPEASRKINSREFARTIICTDSAK